MRFRLVPVLDLANRFRLVPVLDLAKRLWRTIMSNDGKIIQFKQRNNKTKNLERYFDNDSVKPNIDLGSIKTGEYLTEYSNEFFKFNLSVPVEWSTFGYKEMMDFAKLNIDKLDLDEETKMQMLEEMSKNLNLFRSSPFPTKQEGVEDNPTVTCIATRRVNQPNSKAADFIKDLKEQILSEQVAVKFEIVKDIHPIIISGVRFDMIEIKGGSYLNVVVNTQYMSTLKKGYELVFITSWVTEKGLEQINRIVKSITFQ